MSNLHSDHRADCSSTSTLGIGRTPVREALQRLARERLVVIHPRRDTLFLRLDREFNQLSAELARNDFVSDAIQPLQGLSRRFWYMHYKSAADMPLTAKLHADVARAIADGNEQAATQASDRLIDYIESFTKSTLTADS